MANPTKTGSLSDLVPTNFTGGEFAVHYDLCKGFLIIISILGASRVSKVIQKQVKVIPPSSSSSSGHKSDQSVDPGSFTAGQKRRSYAYTPTSKVSYPDSTNRGMSPGGPSVHGTVTKSVSATTERQESSPRRSSVSGTVTKSVSTAAERHGMSPRRSSVFGTVTKPAVNVVERQRDGTTPKVCLVRRKSFGTGQISPSPTKSSPNSVKIAPSTSVAPGRRRSGIPGLTFITPPKISKNGTASTNVPVRRSSSFGGQIKKVSATPTPAGSRVKLQFFSCSGAGLT